MIKQFLAAALMVGGLLGTSAHAGQVSTKSNPEIIGGHVAADGAWPFQIALVSSSAPNASQGQFCGGSLVNKRYILTAAHCVTQEDGSLSPASGIDILVGTQDLSTGGRLIPAAKVVRHPRYDPNTTDFDVAVIKLSSDVTDIKPVKIITPSQAALLNRPGKPAKVIGWGNTSTTDDVFPNELMEVQVPIQSTKACNSASSYNGDLTPRMMCAGPFKGGKDSCQGDSGGPLLVPNGAGKFVIQTGIVSWGKACAAKNFPGVYSRLAILGPWVRIQIAKP